MLNMQLRCGTKDGINLKHFEAHIISHCTHDAFALAETTRVSFKTCGIN